MLISKLHAVVPLIHAQNPTQHIIIYEFSRATFLDEHQCYSCMYIITSFILWSPKHFFALSKQ